MTLVEQYRALYGAIERRDERDVAARLDALYDERLLFQDTFVTVLGRDELVAMNRRALANTRAIETEILDSSETPGQLFMTWKMRYVTRLGPTLVIEGATHARVRDGKVTHQRDYWDLAGSLAAGVPAVGNVYRLITSKLV